VKDAQDGAEWQRLVAEIGACQACGLCQSRTNAVVGRGCARADVLFIGEGPGENEDLQGLPFVGKAGRLLDLALEGLSYPADSYYIANIVKCRPPSNRQPTDEEAAACLPFLRRQLVLIQPKLLVCLGATALKHILGKEYRITRDRGRWVERKGWRILATFHPAALLRDPSKKEPMWLDMKEVRRALAELRSE